MQDLQNSLKHICYYAEINEEKEEEFAIPEEEKCNKFKGNPKTLGPEGFALPGTKLNTGDMVIGRIAGCHSDDPQKKPYNNCSSVYEHQWSGWLIVYKQAQHVMDTRIIG